jgi:chromosome partitioning protein
MSLDEVAEFLGISIEDVYKKLEKQGLKLPMFGNNYYMNFTIARKFLAIPFHKKKIAVEIVKGGTGKTTTVDNISSCLNAYGARVLMIDADPQGNLTVAKGVDDINLPVLIDVLNEEVGIEQAIIKLTPGLDLIPSRIDNIVIDTKIISDQLSLEKLFDNLLGSITTNYDFIIVDLPPSLGLLVTAATLFSDMVVAPLNPDILSVTGFNLLQDGIKRLEKNFQKNLEFRYFLNKYNSNTMLSNSMHETLHNQKQFGNILQTKVRYTQKLQNLMSINRNVFSSLERLSVRDDFNKLTCELLEITPFIETNKGV